MIERLRRDGCVALLGKNLLFTVVVPGSVAGLGPYWISAESSPRSGLPAFAAVLLFALGAVIYAFCVWDFASFGRGTPAPIDAPKKLVVRGLYRFTRNPMYVGVLAFILGWAVLYTTRGLFVYAGVVWACFQSFIVVYEEPHLKREFGDDYAAYKQRVGRWFPTAAGDRGTGPDTSTEAP